jgi:FixJ family two-component response regulator
MVRQLSNLTRQCQDTPLPEIPVISIIDDDESVRVATKRLVRSLGFIGHAFASADEFLQSSWLNDTSCVIADVQMPGLSGVELQKLLTARGNRTPVILITAFPDDRIRAQALEAGAICFLSKPCNGLTLIQCLEMALKRRHDG